MGTTGNSDLRTFFFGTGNAIISLHLSHLTSTYFISLVSPLVIFFKSSGETSGESSLIICFGGATGTSGIFRSDFPFLRDSNDFSFSFFVFSFSFFFYLLIYLIIYFNFYYIFYIFSFITDKSGKKRVIY